MWDAFFTLLRAAVPSLLLFGDEKAQYNVGEAVSFEKGDRVELKVNKVTSTNTLYPMDYYSFPFCKPTEGVQRFNENLGEFLSGDRVSNSPYVLKMKTDMYCEQVCIANLKDSSKLVEAIHNNYHNNWILDNLPAASKIEDRKYIITRYWQGFPIGFVDTNNNAYVNNHVNIEVVYHEVEGDPGNYHVVQFVVQPFSIKHDFEPSLDLVIEDGHYLPSFARINYPIPSCCFKSTVHTEYDMVAAPYPGPQLASGKNKDLPWASRWDAYIYMNNAVPDKVHWHGIASGMIIVSVLSAMIAAILVRNLRRDVSRYNKVSQDEESCADELEINRGWKSVQADVFRPPNYPMLMSVLCGTGTQLLCMSLLVIVFSALGFISPAPRGHLITVQFFLFVMLGGVNGYVAARLYKTFQGKHRQCATAATALTFPGLLYTLFLIMNALAVYKRSTFAVPSATLLVLTVIWFGVSTPLVFLGAFFGYRQDVIPFPVDTSSIPRPIPDQPWLMRLPFTVAISGILPFGSCFVEYYYIIGTVWLDYVYYKFGFLLLVFLILVIMLAEISVLFTYFQLNREDYHWWWRSFCNAGSISMYVFIYSIIYFVQIEANEVATYMLYFGYMGLVSISLFMMTGCIGLAASLWFNRAIFSLINGDL